MAWGTMALIMDAPGVTALRIALAALFTTLVTVSIYWVRYRPLGFLAIVLLVGWWLRIPATNEANWAPDYARVPVIERAGQYVTIHDIRNFRYRSEEDFDASYYDATYPLDELSSLDLVTSYWAGDNIAHVFVSFGFRDGRHLAVSIETRRRKYQTYSTVAGFFRQYELIYVAGDERDLMGLRTDIRRERVYLYPVRLSPENRRRFFESYLERMERLEKQPEFYNTMTNNCTTNILARANEVAPAISYSWKILASGHAAEYAYDLGLLDNDVPFSVLHRRSLIRRAPAAPIDPDFSAHIRQPVL